MYELHDKAMVTTKARLDVRDEKLGGLMKVMDAAAGRRSTMEILDGMRGVGPELQVANGQEADVWP